MKKLFGKLNGKEIFLYVIKQGNIEVEICEVGARINALKVGGIDIVLGFNSQSDYEKSGCYAGATIGRVANRIANGKFTLNSREYQLNTNNGKNHLHGGNVGFDKKLFTVLELTENSVTMEYISADGEENYPAELRFTVKYTVENDALLIEYKATADNDTLWCTTNHSYFNLDGEQSGDCGDNLLQINADFYTPVDGGLIPTGEKIVVKGTPFDFTSLKTIAKDFDSEELQSSLGYDHNYILNGEHAAHAESNITGIKMDLYTDMYTLQTYLQRNGLREVDLQFFDSWAALYTETITALELAPSGQGYRTRTRVAKFTNLPELLKMYRSFADVKTADMLNLPVPKVDKKVVEIEPTDKILELNADIVKRSERIADGAVEPWEDNMLCVTHDGKMIALDPRCFDKTIPDDSNSKINRCVDNIYTIWKAMEDKRCAQVVFCDMSTPKKMYADYNPEQDFDVYNDIKRKLIEFGIPEEEIAYIHEAKTDQQKQDIFDRVRNGDIRVFLGSTEKCGAGTNFQNKLIALHHLDTPYRPSDLEQREGRIVRQGNENETVSLFTYVTKRTFDAYSYQILETKQRFISQINRGDLSVRVAEDIDDATLTYAEIKAITSDNPKIKRKMEIEMRLGQLNDLEKIYRDNRYALQTQILHAPETLKESDEKIAVYQSDLELRKAHENDLIQIGKSKFEERKDAGSLLIRVVTSGEYVGKTVGFIKGFGIVPLQKSNADYSVKLTGSANYTVYISDSEVGTITRLENCLNGIEDRIEECRQKKENYAKNLSVAREQVDKPFEQAEEAEQLRNELAEIDTELDLGKQEAPIIMDEDTTDKPVVEILDEDDDEDEAQVA